MIRIHLRELSQYGDSNAGSLGIDSGHIKRVYGDQPRDGLPNMPRSSHSRASYLGE